MTVDEFRIGVAETYDVIVQPKGAPAYTIFAETTDRSAMRAARSPCAQGSARRFLNDASAPCARWPTWAWR